jgi:DNA (cytosine-5)-methyltransferase 1
MNVPEIAKIYQDFFPQDKVIVADAHQYLLEHFKEFDFIWSSPPCPSHSDIRRMNVDRGGCKPIYPEMSLYQEIIFLRQFCDVPFVVENVRPYYEPLITPQIVNRHCFWSNFFIDNKNLPSGKIKHGTNDDWQELTGFDVSQYRGIDKRKILRNCVNPKLGLHIFNQAFKTKQIKLSEVTEGYSSQS